MPDISWIGWIVVGFLAGALSGWVFRTRTWQGCLPNIVIGVLGGLVGGWITENIFHAERAVTWFGALIVAFIGALIIRFLIRASERR
jgi:uncharacterized membrane protein YeaQ/YmgE (transglycosylase-associated protein family)